MSEVKKLPRGHAYFRWRNKGFTVEMEFQHKDVPWLEEVLKVALANARKDWSKEEKCNSTE